MKQIAISFFSFFFVFSIYSQTNEELGSLCFDKGDYICAITKYTAVFNSTTGKQKQRAEIKITKSKFCLEQLKLANQTFNARDYKNAKDYYQNILDSNPQDTYVKQQIEKCNQYLNQVSTTLNLSKTSISFTSLGGNETVLLTTNLSTYNVELLPSWCSVQKYPSYFVVSCNSNPTSSVRNAYFTVSSGDKSIRVNISQVAKDGTTTNTTLSVSKDYLYFDSSGGKSQSITVSSNADNYTISKIPSWCTVQKSSNYINITCSANPLKTFRIDNFTITAGDKSVRVYINQEANIETTTNTTLSVSNDYLYFEANGGKSESITVSTNASNYTVTMIPSWCKVETYSGYFIVTCNANYNSQKRVNWFAVTAGNKELKVYIDQKGSTLANKSYKYKKSNPTNLYLAVGVLKPLIFKADGKTLSNLDFGYSFTLGFVKTLGLYAKINSNFSSITGDYTVKTLPYTYYGVSDSYLNSLFNRFGVVGGLMLKVNPIMFYVGAGKGYYYHFVKTDLYNYIDDSLVNTVNLTTMSFSGLETDAGIIINFNKVGLSLGVTSFSFKYYEVNAGLGIRF